MLLAGGQGSRLYALTNKVAKPALPFGGKYRIIDFTLSNCVNSGIDTVGVLTQYQPLELNSYIGNGQYWDLDSSYGGVSILPPYISSGTSGTWYKGTANAIYQNIGFIEQYNPEYVLLLSGDHIYKMNYIDMLRTHREKRADCTIAAKEVPIEEAGRFGIVNTDEDDRIYEFEEKPEYPKNNLVSMGIYIFTWEKLRQYLIDDELDPTSSNDFGKDIIPKMLEANERLVVSRFEGYWKDVGTIDSFWDANMDMLSPGSINLYDTSWRVFTRSPVRPPCFFGGNASARHSIITEGCKIDGNVENSVLFNSVTVEKGANVHYSILMPGVTIKSGASVEYSIVAENTIIEEEARVGDLPIGYVDSSWGITTVGAGIVIGRGVQIPPKAIISDSASIFEESQIREESEVRNV